MPQRLDRRAFLAFAPGALLLGGVSRTAKQSQATLAPALLFQHRDLVRDVVGASHADLPRVKELLKAHPALARASWDWGFGDHEAAIDAASHTGNRPIAELLIAAGARPTVFTAAMFGQLSAVRGMIEASPGLQRTRGPHGLTLLSHARAGGAAASEVLKYLQELGDADPLYPDLPLAPGQQAELLGEYAVETGPPTQLVMEKNPRGELTIASPGVMIPRRVFHQGGLVFNPAGAEAVRIRFEIAGGGVVVHVTDGPVAIAARKRAV